MGKKRAAGLSDDQPQQKTRKDNSSEEYKPVRSSSRLKAFTKQASETGLQQGKSGLDSKELLANKSKDEKQKKESTKRSNRRNAKSQGELKGNTDIDAGGKDSEKGTKSVDVTQADIEASHVKNVGAHVSVSGGLHHAVSNALDIGARAFGLFLRNQRQWNSKPLDDGQAELFKNACKDAGFSPDVILPHGIYLMNCASPNEETLAKSRAALIDELKRCEKLGLTLYNFHPGSTCGEISAEEGITKIAASINDAHKETKYVITLIENMCCQGHTIGGKFEELKAIIDQVQDKSRIGVCFDTCHAYAAGYDISTKEAFNHTMDLFNEVIGLKYLRAVHLNDSKGDCECHLDRHENIGHGKIGLRGFKALMNDARFNSIPMILETPETDYDKEIQKLYSMVEKK